MSDLSRQLHEAQPPEYTNIIKEYLKNEVKRVLKLPNDFVLDEKKGFFDLGMDSLLASELRSEIQKEIGEEFFLSIYSIFKYQTIHQLTEYLINLTTDQKIIESTKETRSTLFSKIGFDHYYLFSNEKIKAVSQALTYFFIESAFVKEVFVDEKTRFEKLNSFFYQQINFMKNKPDTFIYIVQNEKADIIGITIAYVKRDKYFSYFEKFLMQVKTFTHVLFNLPFQKFYMLYKFLRNTQTMYPKNEEYIYFYLTGVDPKYKSSPLLGELYRKRGEWAVNKELPIYFEAGSDENYRLFTNMGFKSTGYVECSELSLKRWGFYVNTQQVKKFL